MFGLSLGMGCGDDSTDGAGGGSSAISDVVYDGGATDEALTALLAATPTVSATQGANFSAPANDQLLNVPPSPTFTWGVGSTGRLEDGLVPSVHDRAFARPSEKRVVENDRIFDDRFFHDVRVQRVESSFSRGSTAHVPVEQSWLQGFLSHERSAHAHGTPTSGAAYLLVFSSSMNDKVLRIFTTNTTYTPATTELDKLKGVATEPIHVQITNAQFDANRIAQDGGPYQGNAIVFHLAFQ